MAGFASYTSAVASTAPHLVTPKRFIYNIISNNNFETLYWLLAGRSMADMLRGGSSIRSRVKFDASSQADFYDMATQAFEPGQSQDGQSINSYWHGHMAYDSWREEVMDINAGGDGDNDVIDETWTQEMYNMMQSLYTVLHKSFSVTFWRRPDKANMGFDGAKFPNSIPVWLNAGTNGLFNQGSASGGSWTSIHGIDPAVNQQYKPYQGTYGTTANTGFSTSSLENIIYNLDLAVRKTSFRPPPISRDWFDKEQETSIDKSGGVIFSDAVGVSKLEWVYRASQDRWQDWMDPFGQPRFKGIPVAYESELDTAPLYLNAGGTTTVASTAAAVTGPRYYGVNAKRMKAYFHRNRFMKFLKPINDRKNPTLWTQYVNSLMTTQCVDRSKHFILTPGNNY